MSDSTKGSPSSIQVTSGLGLPMTTQERVTGFPFSAVTVDSSVVNLGASPVKELVI